MKQEPVRMDEHGVYRVGQTRVMLDGVVAALREGCGPESIVERYCALTLEDAIGAIDFYLANKPDVDAYLKKRERQWEKLHEEQERTPPPVVQRLRDIKESRQAKA